MPTTNARRHVIPAAGEASFTRKTFFQTALESIRDIIGVATTTDRAQVVTDLSAAAVGQGPSTTRPLVVHRADAPGMHRIESTVDGNVWIPASGVQRFTTKAAADSWATSNGGLLSIGDRCFAANVEYKWSGTIWVRDRNANVETITGDANGYLTITHGLGVTPIAAMAEIPDDTPLVGNELKINGGMMSADATTFKVRVYRLQSGAFNPFGSNAVKVAWVAFAP